MSARVAVLVFPGTNSEDETLRAVQAAGLEGELVHWSAPQALARFDAFVLPGGFAYEDRIRAGAVAVHDALMDPVIEAAQAGKFVLGICNGAQILAEAGLVPGTGPLRRPTAAFAPNASGRFMSVINARVCTPWAVPRSTIVAANSRACATVFMNAPEPAFTSSTSVAVPSAIFLLITEPATSGSDSTVPVTSRSA